MNHIGIITAPGYLNTAILTEALWRVCTRNLWKAYFGTDSRVCIARCKHMPANQRKSLALHALAYTGMKYGWAKIALHMADRVLTNGSYVFRRLAFMPKRPICSHLVAQVYSDSGLDFGVAPYEAQPDDIWDYVMNSDNYKIIRHLEPLREEDL